MGVCVKGQVNCLTILRTLAPSRSSKKSDNGAGTFLSPTFPRRGQECPPFRSTTKYPEHDKVPVP